jgi:predicted MPP superfamily phosphohydrolase
MAHKTNRTASSRPIEKMNIAAPTKALLLLAAIVATYATLVEPVWLDINEYPLGSDNVATPITVLHLSDLHLRHFGRRERAVIAAVTAARPDVVVLSGDVIDQSSALPVLEQFLAALPVTRTVAVLGNWEHWAGVDLAALAATYTEHKATLLVNANLAFNVHGRSMQITGLDDDTSGQPALPPPSESPPAELTILAQHSPDWFTRQDLGTQGYTLCLAGHTHGGQVALFGRPLWRPQGSGRFIAGTYQMPGCLLHVSRGIGTSILPIRLGARPQITMFTL